MLRPLSPRSLDLQAACRATWASAEAVLRWAAAALLRAGLNDPTVPPPTTATSTTGPESGVGPHETGP